LYVIAGCAWYTGDTHSKSTLEKSVEQLAEELLDEIVNGIGSTSIRPGVIGEIGTSKTILPGEWRCLETAAIVQKQCNLAMQVHIYPWPKNGLEVTDFLLAQGVAPDRIVICHSDIAPDYNYITALFKRGIWVEMDNLGKEFTPADGGFANGTFATD
jgi:phosphotriesterase-related protein